MNEKQRADLVSTLKVGVVLVLAGLLMRYMRGG